MSPKDYFSGVKIFNAIIPQTLSTATVVNGSAIDLSITSPQSLVAFLNVYAWTSGTIKVQDVQFDTVNTFNSVNLSTYGIAEVENLLKNDRYSEVDAITQTQLSAVGIAKIGIPNLAINGQKFCRVRFVTTGTVNLDAYAFIAIANNETGLIAQ